jgi:hypothetical protein
MKVFLYLLELIPIYLTVSLIVDLLRALVWTIKENFGNK